MKSILITFKLIAVLIIVSGCNAEMPLDNIYGEWSYADQDGDEVTGIDLIVYHDSETIDASSGFTYLKGMSQEDYAEFEKSSKKKYGSRSFRLNRELNKDHLVLYVENEGKKEIKYEFKILKSNEKTMTVELIEASEDTRIDKLKGQQLTFKINRKRNKKPTYKKKGRGLFAH